MSINANDNVVGSPLVVCTAHIHWDPEFCDVKLVQTMMLAHEVSFFQIFLKIFLLIYFRNIIILFFKIKSRTLPKLLFLFLLIFLHMFS